MKTYYVAYQVRTLSKVHFSGVMPVEAEDKNSAGNRTIRSMHASKQYQVLEEDPTIRELEIATKVCNTQDEANKLIQDEESPFYT